MELKDQLAEIFGQLSKTAQAWANLNTPEEVSKRVFNLLEKNANGIVLKALGFDDRWGKLELDHCNGRTSTIDDAIRNHALSAVTTWVSKNMPTFPKLSSKQKKTLQKEYQDLLYRRVRDEIHKAAEQDAARIVRDELTKLGFKTDCHTHEQICQSTKT